MMMQQAPAAFFLPQKQNTKAVRRRKRDLKLPQQQHNVSRAQQTPFLVVHFQAENLTQKMAPSPLTFADIVQLFLLPLRPLPMCLMDAVLCAAALALRLLLLVWTLAGSAVLVLAMGLWLFCEVLECRAALLLTAAAHALRGVHAASSAVIQQRRNTCASLVRASPIAVTFATPLPPSRHSNVPSRSAVHATASACGGPVATFAGTLNTSQEDPDRIVYSGPITRARTRASSCSNSFPVVNSFIPVLPVDSAASSLQSWQQQTTQPTQPPLPTRVQRGRPGSTPYAFSDAAQLRPATPTQVRRVPPVALILRSATPIAAPAEQGPTRRRIRRRSGGVRGALLAM